MNIPARWKLIAKRIREVGADAYLVKNPSNVRYLHCPTIPQDMLTALVVFRNARAVGIVSALESHRARDVNPDMEYHVIGNLPGVSTSSKNLKQGIKAVLEGADTVLTDSVERIRGVKFKKDSHLDKIRQSKEAEEIRYIKRACAITDKAAEGLVEFLRPGVTEMEVAEEIDRLMMANGAQGTAFSTIVAFGKNSGYPHHYPTKKKLRARDVVVCDFGAMYNGYCADMTRSYFIGTPTRKMKDVYEAVRESQAAGIKSAKLDMPTKAIDKACRDVIKEYGFG
ncbi:MAG: hypothetical protein DRG33_08285, partial [Deltaproteobacteria bacterium]